MNLRHVVLVAGLLGAAPSVIAAPEVSFLTGVFNNVAYKTESKSGNSASSLGAGVRYADLLEGRFFWFTQGSLDLRSYGKGSMPSAPSSSVNLDAGGGIRYYFDKLTDRVEPYALVSGSFKTERVAVPTSIGYTENAKNGLYYGADFGIRISLQREFFVDFEMPLFNSALFATEKQTDAVYGDGTTTTTSTERQRFELYAATTGSFSNINVALGYRF